MKPAARLGLLCAAIALFLFLNADAYQKGYFRDDDYDNAVWTRVPRFEGYVEAFFTPKYIQNNFRPVGHYFFRVMANAYDLDYPKWLPWIHALHFVNLILIWLLARRFGASLFASSVGALFFLLHAAIVEAVWLPMYVFDQFCTLFGLACLLLYLQRLYLLSFVAFWFALKSKEPALVLPLSLLAIEYWFGGRKWWRPVPYLLVSLSFGLQGILANRAAKSSYSLSLAPTDLLKTITFYASQIWLIPLAGLLLLAVPFFVRNKAIWLGLLLCISSLAPVLLLPNRISGAYLYLPLAALAFAIACFVNTRPVLPVVVIAGLWLALNIHELRKNQAVLIHQATSVKSYVRTLSEEAPKLPANILYLLDNHPDQFHVWGIRALLRQTLKRNDNDIRLETVQNGDAFTKLSDPNTAHLVWNGEQQRLRILQRAPADPLRAFLDFKTFEGEWQLGEGWHQPENGARWAEIFATAILQRPQHAAEFQIQVNTDPQLLTREGSVRLLVLHPPDILINLGIDKPGPQSFHMPAPAGRGGPARIEFLIGPEYTRLPDSQRALGLRIQSFGFAEK